MLLATPLNYLVLKALASGPKQVSALRQQAGSPAQTTLRAQLGKLSAIGAIEKHRRNRFPGTLEYELTGAGRDLLFVVKVLEDWLRHAPQGPLPLNSTAAKAAVKALAEGWSATMLRALGAGPRSLTELDRVIASLSYPSLERRLAAMRLAGMIDTRPSKGRGTPYAVNEWLRQGLAPLVAAARWERRHESQATAPIGRLDVEAILLLAAPMLRSIDGLHGSCRLAAELGNGRGRRLAGVTVELSDGAVGSCTTSLNGDVEAWALGPPTAWLSAVIEGDAEGLELGGDCALARALIKRLHEVLFRTDRIPALDSDRTIEEDELN